MKFPKLLTVGFLSLASIAMSALPGMARPGYIYFEANVRSQPTLNSARIDGLPTGTSLEVSRVSGRWYYVRSRSSSRTEGWVSSDLVRFSPDGRTYGTLLGNEGDVINIRSAPNSGSRVKHTGIRGDIVEAGESTFVPLPGYGRTGYRWYRVTYPSGASGWVRGDLIAL